MVPRVWFSYSSFQQVRKPSIPSPQSIRTSGKSQRACYLAPKTLSWCIFCAFIPRVWFSYSSFQQIRQPSIPSPVEEDTPKIRDMTGTVFIQGPYIVLPVLRCIMFNDSYLRACMKLRIVQKIRFSLLESGRTKAWCLGLVSRPSAKAQEPVARSRGLVIQPPKLSVGAKAQEPVERSRGQWQEVEGFYLTPNTLSWCIF